MDYQKGLFDARVASITKKNIVFQYIFVKIHEVFKVNIIRMIKCDLLKFLFN